MVGDRGEQARFIGAESARAAPNATQRTPAAEFGCDGENGHKSRFRFAHVLAQAHLCVSRVAPDIFEDGRFAGFRDRSHDTFAAVKRRRAGPTIRMGFHSGLQHQPVHFFVQQVNPNRIELKNRADAAHDLLEDAIEIETLTGRRRDRIKSREFLASPFDFPEQLLALADIASDPKDLNDLAAHHLRGRGEFTGNVSTGFR